jgi:hypothetical protein
MKSRIEQPVQRPVINRRAFLRGAGGVAIGLPFLEGLQARSAWAQDAQPRFAFFIVAACGVVANRFYPAATGALSAASLGTDKAVGALAPHAANLLIVRGVNFNLANATNCGHAQGLAQSLTGKTPNGGGQGVTSSGPSVDWELASKLNPNKDEPLNLYAGNRKNGYIAERISFKAGGSGQVRTAVDNPYTLYSKLTNLAPGGGGTTNPPPPPPSGGMADLLVLKRKSVNDLIREELNALRSRPELSAADKQNLDLHFTSIRQIETTMDTMASNPAVIGEACSKEGIDAARLDALKSGFAFTTNGMIEEVAKLHMQVVAVAFACNFNRVAAMQWGDGTDQTRYNVPSNKTLNWPFHHLSHRVESDSAAGNNPTAEAAHAEIDRLRMETFKAGLDAFAARGLQDKAIVMWTNHVADGPSHNMRNVPHIIWGSPGGYLKKGQYVDAGNVTNNRMLATLVTALGQSTSGLSSATGDIIAAMKA